MDTKDSKTKIRHKRRYFFTGPKHVGPGGHLSLNVNAFNALNKIAEHGGQTVQGVIYDILEDHLVTLAENKEIDWPNEPLKSVLLLP
jgi:macrodomain Ter protein organizer (MatP/YcbG family)